MTLRKTIRWLTALELGLALMATTAAAQEAPEMKKVQDQTAAIPVEHQAATTGRAQQEEPAIQSWKDKLSYAIGADLARGLKLQRIDVNVELLLAAVRDGFAGNKQVMTDDDVSATLKRFDDERKHDYEHAKAMLAEKNRKAGEAFFAENLKKEGVVTLPSGLQYRIVKQGDGKKPTLDDNVVCHYRAALLDGTEFDSSYKRNQPATVPVKALIKGWAEALQLMPVGSKWQLFIPPQLGYGDRVVGGIAPNAMLVFEVELISIQDKTKTVSAVRSD
jgi:FKBP-type peptidyl-prolyl cis-trans isomerase FklB